MENNTCAEIRIGNDLRVRWGILTNGQPETLEGRNLTLELHHNNGVRELADFTVSGNTLLWSFPGREQRWTGHYILTLYENKGLPGMAVIDTLAFKLVARMFNRNGLQSPEETVLETGDINMQAGSYPLATEEYPGLMSPEDKKNIRILLEIPVLTAEQATEIARNIFNQNT